MREPVNIKFYRSDNGMIKIRLLKKYVPFLLQKKNGLSEFFPDTVA